MEPEAGPAEYLFQNPKYHDCYLTVGDPATGNVEKIGVSVRNLAAHSTVFRHLLVESDLADPTGENTKITDVTPEVFKLMLIHVYGEQLPTISKDTAVGLLMCADKYNIKQLVSLTCGLLKPESVDQVFPALRCVAYITVPDLESSVQKIVQEQTNLLITNKLFLELDENSIEYIAKQEKLAITEIDLWKALVKWGLAQGPESSLRQVLKKSLQHVRLLTLKHDDFLKEVMPKNVLTSEETLNLLKALPNDQCLESTGLCSLKANRSFFKIKTEAVKTKYSCEYSDGIKLGIMKHMNDIAYSNFTLTVGDSNIEVVSFTCRTIPLADRCSPKYKLTCGITVIELNSPGNALCSQTKTTQFVGDVIREEDLEIPWANINYNGGDKLILKANTAYNINLQFNEKHPVFSLFSSGGAPIARNERRSVTDGRNFTVKFNTQAHIKHITFKK